MFECSIPCIFLETRLVRVRIEKGVPWSSHCKKVFKNRQMGRGGKSRQMVNDNMECRKMRDKIRTTRQSWLCINLHTGWLIGNYFKIQPRSCKHTKSLLFPRSSTLCIYKVHIQEKKIKQMEESFDDNLKSNWPYTNTNVFFRLNYWLFL